MLRAKPPADDLPSFEVEDDCEVVLLAPEAEMSEVLYPSAGIRHVFGNSVRPVVSIRYGIPQTASEYWVSQLSLLAENYSAASC